MTKDEALKLALEALSSGEKMKADGIGWWEYDSRLVKQAITAIEEALAQTSTQCEKQPAQGLNTISTEELIYMAGVHDGKVLEREACAKLVERDDSMRWSGAANAIRARGNT